MGVVAVLLRQFGASAGTGIGGPAPTIPTISATDNGDGTATVTISGGSALSANVVYTLEAGGTVWVNSGSRTGNGTVIVTLADGRYFVYVEATLNSQSVVSLVLVFRLGTSSASLTHSPADIVRNLLVSLGHGTLPSANGVWPISVDQEQSDPDNVITCYDTSGILQGRIQFTGEIPEHHGVQVRVRSLNHIVGYTKARALAIAIDETVYQETVIVNGTQYFVHSITRRGGVAGIGKETPTSKRNIFTLNAIVSLRQV